MATLLVVQNFDYRVRKPQKCFSSVSGISADQASCRILQPWPRGAIQQR